MDERITIGFKEEKSATWSRLISSLSIVWNGFPKAILRMRLLRVSAMNKLPSLRKKHVCVYVGIWINYIFACAIDFEKNEPGINGYAFWGVKSCFPQCPIPIPVFERLSCESCNFSRRSYLCNIQTSHKHNWEGSMWISLSVLLISLERPYEWRGCWCPRWIHSLRFGIWNHVYDSWRYYGLLNNYLLVLLRCRSDFET